MLINVWIRERPGGARIVAGLDQTAHRTIARVARASISRQGPRIVRVTPQPPKIKRFGREFALSNQRWRSIPNGT
jgi:hypothetical protein